MSKGCDLRQDNAIFFMCDLQEKFRPAIHGFDVIVQAAQRLTECCKILSIPLLVTEQYPSGLGPTVSNIDISHAKAVVSKTEFTMITDEMKTNMAQIDNERKKAILFGIEAHVCVLQTALDLLAKDFEVVLVVDATSSRSLVDRHYALKRLEQAGVIISTTEAILFQLVRDKNHPQFKAIQGLIRNPLPDLRLLKHNL